MNTIITDLEQVVDLVRLVNRDLTDIAHRTGHHDTRWTLLVETVAASDALALAIEDALDALHTTVRSTP